MAELILKNLTFHYKNTNQNVLQNVNFTFESGKLYAVVGPSGSGKSTLLSLMAGLLQPTDGDVSLDGQSYKTLNLDQLRREKLTVIFQAFHLFPLLTAIENVSFPMEINGLSLAESMPRAAKFLEDVGIDNEKHKRYPANLSGGEQQRVAIARALATGAGILLADEPTGNLDEANSVQVMDLLLELAHTKDRCVIVVTHDLELAARADQILPMKDKTLVDA